MLAKKLLGAAKSAVVDAYYNLVTLLLPGNGTNGAQNNTFIDGSSNAFSITRNGNTTQGTFSPYGNNWSNYFDGTGDNLSIADNTAFTLTANFTIECWIYPTAGAADRLIISKWGGTAEYYIFIQANNVIGFAWGPYSASGLFGGALLLSGNNAFALNTWSHVAVVRNSNTFTLYVNGTSIATATNSAAVTDGSEPLTIGDYGGGSYPFAGYISNARIVKGTAVYTAAFTPPTAPLTAITNTSLLTCQSNRFIDNSSNAFAITRNGDVSVQRFSPFSPTAAYASGTIGGSGYFDGTGDYLTAPSNAAFNLPGDFTMEVWVYFTSRNASYTSCIQYDTTVYLGTEGTQATFYADTPTAIYLKGGTIIDRAWNHIAVARSGSSVRLWLNGASVANATNSGTVGGSTPSIYINSGNNGTSYQSGGYYTDARIVKGTAVYNPSNTTITIPTAPLTAVSGTSLLCNFTNAGITDATAKNDLETVGNAQISTAQSKFGGSSMYFDGTGDWLISRTNSALSVGSGNFTIEFWVYLTGSGTNSFVDTRVANDAAGVLIQTDTSRYLRLFTNGSGQITDTVALTQNQWVHVALVRSSTTTTLYKDGTSIGTYSDSNNYNAGGITVGSNFGLTTPMTGYIDDLRITKGYARYTANFTPPTAPFALQ
jgi:uncharacterized protein (DUF427 family)